MPIIVNLGLTCLMHSGVPCVKVDVLLYSSKKCFSSFQIKNDVEAQVLCMTAIGNIKLQQGNMEDTKVCTFFSFDCRELHCLQNYY